MGKLTKRVARKVMTSTPASHLSWFQSLRGNHMSTRPATATSTTAARTVLGRWWKRGVRRTKVNATTDAATQAVTGVLPPDCSVTAVRENPPVVG